MSEAARKQQMIIDALRKANDLARDLEKALEALFQAREAQGGGCRFKAALNLLDKRIENCASHPALAQGTGRQGEPIPDYGDHMTIEEFRNGVKSALFTNDDGGGFFATKDEIFKLRVDCSKIYRDDPYAIPAEFTHVVWFNK